jgi:diphosphomevalonate decarboxylase
VSDPSFFKQASYLARLGSGSACRSIWGPVVVWGETPSIPEASQEYGWSSDRVHPVFADFQDTILLIDQGQKSVSSTVGHQLMVGHPFAEARFKQAHKHLEQMMEVLAQGDLGRFVDLVEREALTLHALMMASNPSFVLMKPATLAVIEKIRAYRKATQHPVCFTLDAGANVHVLYPKSISKTVLQWIQDELVVYCEKESYICDSVGRGSSPING